MSRARIGLVVLLAATSCARREDAVAWQRTLVAQEPVVRDVSDMRLLSGPPVRVVVAGTCGAFDLDLSDRSVSRETAFELPCPPYLPTTLVETAGGELELARFEAGWTGPTAIVRRDGPTRWARATPARCARPMDLDADGHFEVLVGEANDRTVRLLDDRGMTIWEREWEDDNARAIAWDVDEDGMAELLYVDGQALRVCGRDGRELFATTPPGGGYVNAIEIVPVVDVLAGAWILVGAYAGEKQWFHAYDRDAKRHVAMYSPERVAPFVRARRVGERFLKIENLLKQAPVAGYASSELRLAISDREGRLLFEDRLSKPGKATATADGAVVVLDESPLRFLVGYGDTVWQYEER
jgi:hypothetical protein